MAEGCIQDASVLEALQVCRRAAKVGEMLPALQQVSYRLSSGGKQATGSANACMLWHLTCCYLPPYVCSGEGAQSASLIQADAQIQIKLCMILLGCLGLEQVQINQSM